MKTILTVFAVVLLACGCQSGNDSHSLVTAKRPVQTKGGFGEEEQGLALKIDTAKPQYKVGDEIAVTFTFKNVSDKAIVIADITDASRSCYHGFEFLNTAGKPIAQDKPEVIFGEKAPIRTEVQPGKTVQHKVILNHWKLAGLGHPYTKIGKETRTIIVTGVYFTPKGYTPKDGKTWLGSIRSKPIKIEIVK